VVGGGGGSSDSSGSTGFGGGVPYYVATGTTFSVPEFYQALFHMPIDVDGMLDIAGYLIEV
jgi:hypothetical protein